MSFEGGPRFPRPRSLGDGAGPDNLGRRQAPQAPQARQDDTQSQRGAVRPESGERLAARQGRQEKPAAVQGRQEKPTVLVDTDLAAHRAIRSEWNQAHGSQQALRSQSAAPPPLPRQRPRQAWADAGLAQAQQETPSSLLEADAFVEPLAAAGRRPSGVGSGGRGAAGGYSGGYGGGDGNGDDEAPDDKPDDDGLFDEPGPEASAVDAGRGGRERGGPGQSARRRPGQPRPIRRVNNLPLLLAAGLLAVFVGGMALVLRERADEQASARQGAFGPAAVPSASRYAEEIVSKSGPAGMACRGDDCQPPSLTMPQRLADDEALALDPLDPLDPELDLELLQDEAEAALPLDDPQAEAMRQELAQMKLALFKEALTARTHVNLGEGQGQGQGAAGGPRARIPAAEIPPSSPPGPLTPTPPAGSGAASPGSSAGSGSGSGSGEQGGGFMDRLNELQGQRQAQATPGGARSGSATTYEDYQGEPGRDRWELGHLQVPPRTPFELRAGAVIPATMLTGINSDVAGQVMAQVAQHVYDTPTGDYLLIPQGSRLVGTYGSEVRYGQERVLVAWQRIVFPDGKALDIGAMPGADGAGYSGFRDRVNNHYLRIFAGALLLSGITAGVSLSSQGVYDRGYGRMSLGDTLSQSLGQQLGTVSAELVRRNMNIAPTLEIRPGYRFNVVVIKDLTFAKPYQAFDYEQAGQR